MDFKWRDVFIGFFVTLIMLFILLCLFVSVVYVFGKGIFDMFLNVLVFLSFIYIIWFINWIRIKKLKEINNGK